MADGKIKRDKDYREPVERGLDAAPEIGRLPRREREFFPDTSPDRGGRFPEKQRMRERDYLPEASPRAMPAPRPPVINQEQFRGFSPRFKDGGAIMKGYAKGGPVLNTKSYSKKIR